jgi:ERCC4-type nuclease
MKVHHITNIKIDNREKQRGTNIQEYLTQEKIPSQIQQLEYGDYLVNNKIIYEYKTWKDLLNSIQNQTLFNEIFNQSREYSHSYLLIVGNKEKELREAYYTNPSLRRRFTNYHRYSSWVNNLIKGAIRRCRVVCNVITTENEKTATVEMIKQSEKCLDGKAYGGVVRPSQQHNMNPCKYALMSIKGIGDKTSDNIVESFNLKCWKDLNNINFDKLVEVKGVNEEIAQRFWTKQYGEKHRKQQSNN